MAGFKILDSWFLQMCQVLIFHSNATHFSFSFFHLSFFFTAINLVKHSLVIFSILTSFQRITPLISMFLFLSLSLLNALCFFSFSLFSFFILSVCLSFQQCLSFSLSPLLNLQFISFLLHFHSLSFTFLYFSPFSLFPFSFSFYLSISFSFLDR